MNGPEGIYVYNLPVSTTLMVETLNHVYEIYVLEDTKEYQEVTVDGGHYFKGRQRAVFNGSTWGGSNRKLGWICQGMMMVFTIHKNEHPEEVITTQVVGCRIIGPNKKWSYEM